MTAPHDHIRPTTSDFPDLTNVTVLAQGAHATVYQAHQMSLRREVALKIDHRVLTTGEEHDRFEQESRAIMRLAEHPGILATYDAGITSAGHPFTIAELCRGSYADQLAHHGAMSPGEVQQIGIRIADALALAHQNRVLHRDIKPANLLIDHRSEPVLADFGVASLMDSRNEATTSGTVVRAAMTPAYAPLETFHLRPSGEAGDVYSLAATLYALLSGRPPRFPADDRELELDDVMALFGEPVGDIPGVSQVLLGMLRAAMTNNPAGRPSALQFRDMLESVPVASATTALPVVSQEHTGAAPAVPEQPRPQEQSTEWAQDVSRRPSPSPRPQRPAWGGAEPSQALVLRPDANDRLPVPAGPKQTRRERRIAERGGKDGGGLAQLLLVGGIAIAIIIAAVTGGIMLISGDDETAAPTAEDTTVAATCAMEDFGLQCLPEPRCFNGDLVDGDDLAAAEPVDCAEPHLWEAYAMGDLSDDVSVPTYGQVRKDDLVRATCLAPLSEGPLAGRFGNSVSDWQSDVLPPDPAEFEEGGDNAFMCVARLKSGDTTTGATFG